MLENIAIVPMYIILIGGGFFFFLASIISLFTDPFLSETK